MTFSHTTSYNKVGIHVVNLCCRISKWGKKFVIS